MADADPREHVTDADAPGVDTPRPAPDPDDVAEQVRKLAAQRDDGAITEAEFEAKKRQLLSE